MKINTFYSFIKRDPMSTVDWTDLPLLPSIADRLGVIDLIRFRAVCKDWTASSSMASAEIEASPDHEPWLLIFGGNNSKCSLVTEHSTARKTVDIPQLKGTTCLASSYGWLLLFRKGSVFFFCPMSRARIDLPGPFPRTVIRNHVTIFSAPPTSKDCVVGVLSRTKTELEFHTIRRGDTCWNEHKIESSILQQLKYAGYHNGLFYFFDEKLRMGRLRILRTPELHVDSVPLEFVGKDKTKRPLLSDEDASKISICETFVPCTVNGQDFIIMRRENHGVAKKQGAWFQPRFHQISEKQIW